MGIYYYKAKELAMNFTMCMCGGGGGHRSVQKTQVFFPSLPLNTIIMLTFQVRIYFDSWVKAFNLSFCYSVLNIHL